MRARRHLGGTAHRAPLVDLLTALHESEAHRRAAWDPHHAPRCRAVDPGVPMPRDVSMVKLTATELAKRAALEGTRLMGGMGYTTEGGMEE
ncbi:MAG: hypothetical protein KDB56_06215 [Mycobacterium sp.]|nr:hypothetical protein [Mycobacterium sp.]